MEASDQEQEEDDGSTEPIETAHDAKDAHERNNVASVPQVETVATGDLGESDSDDNDNGEKMKANTYASRPQHGDGTNASLRDKKRRLAEKTDLKAAVEFIVMVGNEKRHRHWRNSTYKKSQETYQSSDERQNQRQQDEFNMQEQIKLHMQGIKYTGNAPGPASGSFQSTPTRTRWPELHAEDVRLYGISGNIPSDPWPKGYFDRGEMHRRKVAGNNDFFWDRDHGDSLHPLEFMESNLSRVDPPPEKNVVAPSSTFEASIETEKLLEASRVNQLDPDRMKCTVDPEGVPRAMLLRCWQRAVDAASGSTLQQQNPSPAMNAKFKFLKNPASKQQRQKKAKHRCIDLNVDLFPGMIPPSQPPFQCQHCGNDFETKEKLRSHFHGSKKVRGCCWNLIHAKQRALILATLERDVTNQADALVNMVITEIRRRHETEEFNCEDEVAMIEARQPMKWNGILDMCKDALASARGIGIETPGQREVTKTLVVHDNLSPLVLNQQVLEAASYRIIDRYANLPK